ncbi:Slp1p [Sporobolomyces koalae]|uniref:Slp1p n=1 Tax=Sporobolomyces koalae TaxID=500713 RepID=UPI0031795DA2
MRLVIACIYLLLCALSVFGSVSVESHDASTAAVDESRNTTVGTRETVDTASKSNSAFVETAAEVVEAEPETITAPSPASDAPATGGQESPEYLPSDHPTSSTPPPQTPTAASSTSTQIAPPLSEPSPLTASAPPEPALPEVSIVSELPLTSIPSTPEFLSFNEWREKYVVVPDPSIALARRAKKAAQRQRQDVVGTGPVSDRGQTYDGDGTDLGSLFASGEDSADSLGPGNTQEIVDGTGRRDGPLYRENVSPAAPPPVQATSSSPIQPLANVGAGDDTDPLVPLKDRSNYAAFECAAMVHRSSRKTKGASAILVEKKDRYMLTPCSAKPKFVEVELCDEIQIDTIVLANFEFFSSMFKHFNASCSVNYPGTAADWHDLGTFRARNVRGIQVFRPNAIPNFCRYIRINFLSHFGSEYYCPVSLLRVYGYTQLDAYRESERKARQIQEALAAAEEDAEEEDEGDEEEDEIVMKLTEKGEDVTSVAPTYQKERQEGRLSTGAESETQDPSSSRSPTVTVDRIAAPITTTSIGSSSVSEAEPPMPITTELSSSATSSPETAESTLTATPTNTANVRTNTSDSDVTTTGPESSASAPAEHSFVNISAPSARHTLPEPSSMPPETSTLPSEEPSSTTLASSTSSASSPRTAPAVETEVSTPAASPRPAAPSDNPILVKPRVPVARNDTLSAGQYLPPHRPPLIPPPIQQTQPGESIYATIMKRLASLEHNQTLSMHFTEAQSSMLREAFIRIERRLVEVEAMRSRQETGIRQALLELERERKELEREKLGLQSQVGLLAQEIRLEKRLGVIQLAGMFLLIVFIAFTRNIPTSPFLHLASSTQSQRRSSVKSDTPQDERARPPSLVEPDLEPVSKPLVRRASGNGGTKHSSGHSKRFPSMSKSGPRRHYGTAASSSSRSPAFIKSPRAWTPPARHSSAPSEEALSTSVSTALERQGSRRRHGSNRGASSQFEFPRRSKLDTEIGLAIDTNITPSSSSTPLAPFATSPSRSRSLNGGRPLLTISNSDRPKLYTRDSAASNGEYDPYTTTDDEEDLPLAPPAFGLPLTAPVPLSPAQSTPRIRPPKPSVPSRPATSMGISYPTKTTIPDSAQEVFSSDSNHAPLPPSEIPSPPPEPQLPPSHSK